MSKFFIAVISTLIKSLIGSAVMLMLLLSFSTKAEAANRMYWTDSINDRVQRANLDGSGVVDLVTALANPRGIALDVAGGKMYFPDDFVIRQANLDGSGVVVLPTGFGNPFGIALDVADGKMYWTDILRDKIQRANLDGTGAIDLVTGLNNPFGIALDLTDGKMYWTAAGKIQRANLDGTGLEDLITAGLSTFPHGIALDVADGKMYWTDSPFNRIKRANLNGTGVEVLVIGTIPRAIALDIASGKMYWNDPLVGIKRANLNGSGVEVVVATFQAGFGIALELDEVEIITVDIDIKPGSDPNCIKASSLGLMPVAILGNGIDVNDIDVSTIEIDNDDDPDTIGVAPFKSSFNDVNSDLVTDLIFHFETPELNAEGLLVDGNELFVTGELTDGTPIVGSDFIFLAGGPSCFD